MFWTNVQLGDRNINNLNSVLRDYCSTPLFKVNVAKHNTSTELTLDLLNPVKHQFGV